LKTTNAPNERIKRVYFTYMKEARRYSEPSIDAVAKALHRFESYTRYKDFKSFHHQQAVGFKAHLSAQVNGRTKEALSKATLYSTLAALKGFFHWQPGNRVTNPNSPIPMRSISISEEVTWLLPKRTANSVCRRWSKFAT
jgi:site-specific recombinase XerD